MANINFPDPAITLNVTFRVSVSGGVSSAAVGFYAPSYGELPFASFDPSDFTAPQQAANAALRDAMIAKAKARQEEMATARGDTINWVAP